MAVSVENRRPRIRSALSAVVAALMLAPVGVLFLDVWRSASDELTAIQRERDGIAYLSGLGTLLNATAQAQGAALQGGARPAELDRAIATVAQLDQRHGQDLGTRERWTALRAKLAALPQPAAGQQLAALPSYLEASDLMLALFRTARENAGLAADAHSDTFHLQQAAGAGLPTALVQAARLADLTLLAPQAPAAERARLGGSLALAMDRVDGALDEMTDDLRTAADDTDSPTLSSSLLNGVERFRRGVDGLIQGASAVLNAGQGTTPLPAGVDPARGLAQLATIRTDMQAAAAQLSTTILAEADLLLARRADDVTARRWTAVGAAGLACLLALLAVGLAAGGRRGRTDPPPARAPAASPPATGRAEAPPAAGPPRLYGDDVTTAQWERTDVLR